MQLELELLAPAKNKDIGIAAIDCGADAVYIAGPRFGAREGAGNPISEIAELVLYAHTFGAKVYMVVNTILYEHELEEARKTIHQAYEIGCDAVIIQDLGILKMDLPPIPLFASTQTNIRTPQQARFLESLGFKRLILARELSLQQISQINEAVNTDIETFVHGALCVSYSGQCYLSQFLTGRSANRGACAQACRSLYTLTDSNGKILLKDAPVLSLKDFNLSDRIPQLVEAGVSSFKIEGRLKNVSYIKNVVKLYRERIDEFLAENPNYTRASLGNIYDGFTPNPLLTFNRSYTQLFIDGQRGAWRSKDGAKYLGEPVGTVTKTGKDRQGYLQFTYNLKSGSTPIVNGDGLCFVNSNGDITGVRANSCNGNTITTIEKINIPAGSTIYRNYNIIFERELDKSMPRRLIPVKLHIDNIPCSDINSCTNSVSKNSGRLQITAKWGRTNREDENCCSIEIAWELEAASNIELATANLYRQLGKTASMYKFELIGIADDVTVPFLPIGRINELRRELAERIEKHMTERTKGGQAEERAEYANSYRVDTCKDLYKGAGLPQNPQGKNLEYLANCSNSLSEEIYRELGAESIAPAYEIEAAERAELMRTKYCIKYEMGLCPNHRRVAAHDKGYIDKIGEITFKEPLFLLNGKNKLQLKFDCSLCEMIIIG